MQLFFKVDKSINIFFICLPSYAWDKFVIYHCNDVTMNTFQNDIRKYCILNATEKLCKEMLLKHEKHSWLDAIFIHLVVCLISQPSTGIENTQLTG